MTTVAQQHDCLLLDLDGTLFRGHVPTEGAVEALARADTVTRFVTNNASRSPVEVASHLTDLGFDASAEHVVTSAQAAAHLLSQRMPTDARVLVIGSDALSREVEAVGLVPVRRCDDDPAAVVQGHSPHTGWADLAEAALAIRSGALWVATNGDRTFPSERGLLPGNGSMVAALRAATDSEPLVAGKPAPLVVERALQRGRFAAPLVVGDRLDTDIACANAAGLPSLLVLSGVSTAADVVGATPGQRPIYLGEDLRDLHVAAGACAIAAHPAWRVEPDRDGVTVSATDVDPGPDELAIVRATAAEVWTRDGADRCHVRPGNGAAATALRRWALLS